MAYVNIPPNLQDMFYGLSDRIAKLESGPSGPQDTADTAQSTASTAYAQAVNAQSDAATALAQANIAYAQAVSSLKPSAYVISNASQQITSIATNGVTVYSGSSSSSGARVTMNSLGLAGYDSSGTATFSISASTGAAVFSGSITGSAITGSTLNVSGNFIVNSSGYLTATGATITGSITATSGSFTGSIYASAGTIGGFSIVSNDYLQYGTTYLYGDSSSSTTYAFYNNYRGVLGNSLYASSTSSSAIYSNGGITSNTTGNIGTSLSVGTSISSGTSITANGHLIAALTTTTDTSSSSANAVVSAASGIIYRSTSSQRYKVEITPQSIPATSIMALQPKSYVDKKQSEEKGTTEGLPRYVGLIAEDVAQIDVLKDLLVVYNENNEPDAINYDRIAVALIPLLQNHETRLNKLEGK
jgi:hypothetical protein